MMIAAGSGCSSEERESPEQGPVTFHSDVAPILYENCAECHREGQAGPFPLLTYQDVSKRGRQIVDVTQSGFMPPWLPIPGLVEYEGERRLTETEKETLRLWVEQGMPKGERGEGPPVPEFPEGWRLGQPDLIISTEEPYTLGGEGFDVYRNFVLEVPISNTRFIRAVEFRPDNPKVVHHAVIMVDPTTLSRRLQEKDPEPGFGNSMEAGGGRVPDGHFIGWTPGRTPFESLPGLAWVLEPGTDIVLQMHMRPSGKEDTLRPRIGLYFTDRPPRWQPYGLLLRNKLIDIPAGESSYWVRDEYTLPVAVKALSVYPHAHYLGTEVNGYVELPDGGRQWLVHIPEWNFDWQDEYRFAKPLTLPAGSKVVMEWRFDNTTNNVRNPNHPPERVTYGQNSSDEMAELMIEVVPRTPEDLAVLKQDGVQRALEEDIEVYQTKLEASPENLEYRIHVGRRFLQLGRLAEARAEANKALELDTRSPGAHELLAQVALQRNQAEAARRHYERAIELDPENAESLTALARLYLFGNRSIDGGASDRALEYAKRAAELTSEREPLVMETLAMAYAALGREKEAAEAGEQAVQAARDAGQQGMAQEIAIRLKQFRGMLQR